MVTVAGDSPIRNETQDLLGRATTAKIIASEIRGIDASEGYIVGILGGWGCGKTSLVNLVRNDLEDGIAIPVLDFNPWMFSGAEQLVDKFFQELAGQLRIHGERLNDLATDLENYGALFAPMRFLPVVGPWYERLRGVISAWKKVSDKRIGGVASVRKKIVSKMTSLDRPIVIVLDDIDRLRSEEIRDVFKLVRLTGNFPNIVYVLVFDRFRIEKALEEDGLPGRHYLEKVLQLSYDLPTVPEVILTELIETELHRALSDVDNLGRFEANRWADIFSEIVRPLIGNMRDLRRYVAAVHVSARSVGDHIALVDLLGLEAVRVFLPDVFLGVAKFQAALTTTAENYGFPSQSDSPVLKESITFLLEAAGEEREIALAVIRRLFPAARRHVGDSSYGSDWRNGWLRARQVAHPDILAFYLERVAGSGMKSFLLAEKAFALLTDATGFEQFLKSIPANELSEVIKSLEIFEGTYPVEAVVPASSVLLNQIGNLPDNQRGMFSIAPQMVVRRVVLRLMKQVTEESDRELAVRQILPLLDTLSAKSEILNLTGHDEGSGHGLIPIEACEGMGGELRGQIRNASPAQLAVEPDLMRLLLWYRKSVLAEEVEYRVPIDDPLDIALLRSAVSEVKSMSMDSRAISRAQQLQWEALTEILGGESEIGRYLARLNNLRETDGELRDLIALANRYSTGWRPTEF